MTDKSDQKASVNLTNAILELQKRSREKEILRPSTSGRSPKKQKSRKRTHDTGQQNKITKYIGAEKREKKPKTKLKPLDIAKKKSFERSPSFEKYGIVLPSYQQIVADQKEYDRHKVLVEQLDQMCTETLENLEKRPTFSFTETTVFDGEMLDCRNLSRKKLNKAFAKHKDVLGGIVKGKEPSKRHALYQQNRPSSSMESDLKCSTSCVVFTHEQKDHLLDLLSEEFGPENKMLHYFMQVLLPELCLLIFMDAHGMTRSKAIEYLDKRPIDF